MEQILHLLLAMKQRERKREREGAQQGERVLTSSSGHTTNDRTVFFGTPPPEGHTTSQWHLRLAVEPLISSHLVWDFELISINRIFWKHSGGLWVKYFTWLSNAFPITQRWVSKWFTVNGIKERLSNCCKKNWLPRSISSYHTGQRGMCWNQHSFLWAPDLLLMPPTSH